MQFDEEPRHPPFDDISTEQLLTARVLFEGLLSFMLGTEFPLDGSEEGIESIKEEIKEIEVELLTRDYEV